MPQEKKPPKTQPTKLSLLETLLTRPKRDKEYTADLSAQWKSMDKSERGKFVAGAAFGLILLIGALVGVYFIINFLRQLVF